MKFILKIVFLAIVIWAEWVGVVRHITSIHQGVAVMIIGLFAGIGIGSLADKIVD